MLVGSILISLFYVPFPFGNVFSPELRSASAPSSQRPDLLLLGDSISIQYTLALAEQLSRCVDLYFMVKVKNQPIFQWLASKEHSRLNVRSSSHFQKRSRHWINRGSYDAIVLNVGIHDIKDLVEVGKASTGLKTYEANLEAIIKLIKDRSTHVFFVTTLPVASHISDQYPREIIDQANQIAQDLSAKAGVNLINISSIADDNSEIFYAQDGLHLNEQGVDLVADEIANIVKEKMCLKNIQAGAESASLAHVDEIPFSIT